ncbi:oligosaccharide flippase family protein [Bacillus gobiensis]|uniref:oligosaccharide flippase family protein n=1 Tax=Bacillus gobiensis TaxID=1441095 RepID=UPI003D1A9F4A
MNSTTKNIYYVILQQFILLFLPLLTIPYVSRILGPSGVGVVSYSTSIVMLFINLALLGSELYGVKEIAKVKEDKKKLSRIFSEIFIIRFSLLCLATIIYFLLTYIYFDFKFIFYLQAINIFAYMIDINWFYQGIEEFKKILYRNILIKSLGFISIFILVKNKEDIYLYVIILSLSILVGNGFMWIKLNSIIGSFESITLLKLKYHSKGMIALFMAGFSIMIYILTDKIMLGVLSSTVEVGLYEQGQKIVNVLVTIVTAFSAVMLPKATQIINRGNLKDISRLITKSISLIIFSVLPICTIFLLVSSSFIPWFLGEGFHKSTIVSQLLAPIIFIKAISVMLGSIYFIPLEKNKEYTIPLIVGAIVNMILNLFLIPYYGAIGSSIATLSTETIILIIQLILIRKFLCYSTIVEDGAIKHISANFILVMIVVCCKKIIFFNSNFYNVIFYGSLSVGIYLVSLIIMKDKYLKLLITKITNKFIKKRNST